MATVRMCECCGQSVLFDSYGAEHKMNALSIASPSIAAFAPKLYDFTVFSSNSPPPLPYKFEVAFACFDQLALYSVRHSFKPIVRSELAVDMVEVIAKSLGSDPELLHNCR